MTGFTDLPADPTMRQDAPAGAPTPPSGDGHGTHHRRETRAMKERFAQLRLLRGAPREIRMVHQGSLRSGVRASVTFALDRGASGPASVFVSCVRRGDQPTASDGARVQPGEAATLDVSLTAAGRLKVVVDVPSELDAAMLTVTTGAGLVRDHAPTVGDTVWVYTVT